MATKQENVILGLPADATSEQTEKRLRDLIAAEQLVNDGGRPAKGEKVMLIALTPKTRGRATYEVPGIVPGESARPLVLDLNRMLSETEIEINGKKVKVDGKANLEKLENDPRILVLRLDTPLTPINEIQRCAPSS